MRPLCLALMSLLLFALPALAQEDGLRLPEEQVPPLDDPFMPVPPGADDAPPALTPDGGEADTAEALPADPEARLDQLFEQLRREPSSDEAREIASRIEQQWSESGSATIDLLMVWASQAMVEENNDAAQDLLDQAIVLAPGYAEAWNRRAHLNFRLSRFGTSLADIEQTLIREPRHFGALMGLAAILEELSREEQAIEAYGRVLEVYPTLRQAQDAIGRLMEERSDQPA